MKDKSISWACSDVTGGQAGGAAARPRPLTPSPPGPWGSGPPSGYWGQSRGHNLSHKRHLARRSRLIELRGAEANSELNSLIQAFRGRCGLFSSRLWVYIFHRARQRQRPPPGVSAVLSLSLSISLSLCLRRSKLRSRGSWPAACSINLQENYICQRSFYVTRAGLDLPRNIIPV